MSSPAEVNELLRQLSGQATLLSTAVARHVGLRPADLEVLGEIALRGPLTAGQLAALTGLSGAAVTGLIDRLERAGMVVRKADESDRRRVLVATAARAERVAALYGSLEADVLRALAGRSTRELATIARFLREMLELGHGHVAKLHDGSAAEPV